MNKVTVLITVYNGEQYLEEAIRSILAQSFSGFELLVVDDGSTDDSAAVAERLAVQDSRIRVSRLIPNKGRTHALMHGLDLAQGEYVAILDADDIAMPDRLARQVQELDERPELALVGCYASFMDADGNETGQLTPAPDSDAIRATLPYSNPIAHSGVMYRRELARQVGGYRHDYPYAHDMRLFISLLEAGHELRLIPERLVCIREHERQMTVSPSLELIRRDDMARTFRLATALEGVPASSKRMGMRAAMYCEMRCVRALWPTSKQQAMRRLAKTFSQHPLLAIRALAVNADLRRPLPKE